jgi:hypothetical protein
MNSQGHASDVVTPWGSPSLTTEEGLRAAQEYFYQTHAKRSQMVAEGRAAHGVMKSYVRRKLEKEMGEDFKMYTGQDLGEGAPEESLGIRGELNELLRFVYERIAPGQPIVSAIQEDATILRHPHGALEVCFGMVFFYNSLLKKHLTLVSNRRKTLKSILDEELFKWIWRLSVNFLLSGTATRIDMQDYRLTAGLPCVPAERQRATMPVKIFEIGQFMLGKTLQDSDLRFPLVHYFATFLRTLQSEVLAQPGLANPEEIYAQVMRRKQTDPIDNVLVAIDVLMNMKGNSADSFDDILSHEGTDIEQFMSPQEAQFLRYHDPYADAEAFGAAVRMALPAAQKSEMLDQGGGGSLAMRLLLVLRAVTPAVRAGILDKIPAPLLVMLRSRILNGPQDNNAKGMAEWIKAALDMRTQRGEQFVVPAARREGMADLTAAKHAPPSPAAAPGAGHAAGAAGAHRAQSPAPARPAAPADAPAPVAAPADAPAPAAAAPAAGPPTPDALLDQRLLIAWRQEGGQFTVIGMTPRELLGLVGPEPRFLLPWVMLALQTGQVFNFPAANVNKELIEKLVKAVAAKAAGLPPPQLGKPQVAQLAGELKDLPHQKALVGLIVKGKVGDAARQPGKFSPALESLLAKFGSTLGEFLRGPSSSEFRDLRVGLSEDEKQLVQVLQKLSRLGSS